MPDIINNVINDLPASGHNIYVCELAPFFQTGLYTQQSKSFGGQRTAKNNAGSRSHLWDLYTLSYNIHNNSIGDYFTLNFSTVNYKPLYCSNFSDNAGSNIYQPVRNFSGLSLLNLPVFSQYKYTGNFSFNPILSTNVNQQFQAESIIYRASLMPLYPLLFCSTIPTHKSFGPSFLSSFEIRVDGMNNLGDVEISCSLTGGRSIISPNNVSIVTGSSSMLFMPTSVPGINLMCPFVILLSHHWSNSPKKVIKHGELTSWVLSWISQGEGKNFLDDFSSQLEAHASEGLKQFDFGKEIFQLQKAIVNSLLLFLTSTNTNKMKKK
jgi:hypothetical protein